MCRAWGSATTPTQPPTSTHPPPRPHPTFPPPPSPPPPPPQVRLAAERGRATNPNLELGVCGEHGGDPKSIEFVANIVDYVSCSPLRVPIARLAAAQAAIKLGAKAGANDHCQD